MRPPYRQRLARLRGSLREHGADSFLTLHPPNIFYLCGFSGSSGALLVEPGGATLFTDSRYTLQAREEVSGARVTIAPASLALAAGERLNKLGRIRVAVEAGHLSLSQRDLLAQSAGRRIRLLKLQDCVESLRAIKDSGEIALMKAAAGLGSLVFEAILPLIKPGIREFELAAEIEYLMRRAGASKPAFETIVAFGERSALPHAHPTARKLRKNELVVLDLGAILRHYCCDLTRTVFVGRATRRITQWYQAVLEAQVAARQALRPGRAASEVDEAARAVLKRAGLDRFFTHSLGHGLGLEVHEAPRLARGQKQPLQAFNVVTLEPGVYVEGVGGIRIEDDAVVTPRGAQVLTTANAQFLEL